MSERIVYNHGDIDVAVLALNRVNDKASGLVESGRASRLSLAASWEGFGSQQFQEAYSKLEAANDRIIAVTDKARRDLGSANDGMRTTDKRVGIMFGA
jgi:uncharacterized protein YukE